MGETLIERLRQFFDKVVQAQFPAVGEFSFPIEVTRSTQEHFGHYQFNSALKLAKLLQQNPRQIAEKIIETARSFNDPLIQQLQVAGAGFINIWLNPGVLSQLLIKQLQDPQLLAVAPKKEKVIIDFSSPNVAKEMHVGHLRSTIIGDCLARIFEFLGQDVVRLNHIGDFGTSFGMLIAYIKEHGQESLKDIEATPLTQLVEYYRSAKKLFDEDAAFKKRSQLEVVALQGGDPEAVAIWQGICMISRRAYQEIYDLLDVKLVERGESFYNPWLQKIVDDVEKKGLITLSDGAKCIFLRETAEGGKFTNREGETLPLMIQKSDGGYNYDTTDLAAIYHRIFIEKADRIIYVTDSGQAMHFEMLFAAAEKAGYLNRKEVRVDHVPFGLVLGTDGKKFRTRSGETEKLIDLLSAAVNQARVIVDQRHPDWSEQERQELSESLGIGAIKYADLSSNRMSDYVFSYEKMLRFEGNTIAFVLYAYVRAKSIQRKVGIESSQLLEHQAAISLVHPTEQALGLHLLRFSEMISTIVNDLLPNRLTDYLYELAEKFNLFFRDCRVEGVPEQDSRLLLTALAISVFERGFSLLGVKAVERM